MFLFGNGIYHLKGSVEIKITLPSQLFMLFFIKKYFMEALSVDIVSHFISAINKLIDT